MQEKLENSNIHNFLADLYINPSTFFEILKPDIFLISLQYGTLGWLFPRFSQQHHNSIIPP